LGSCALIILVCLNLTTSEPIDEEGFVQQERPVGLFGSSSSKGLREEMRLRDKRLKALHRAEKSESDERLERDKLAYRDQEAEDKERLERNFRAHRQGRAERSDSSERGERGLRGERGERGERSDMAETGERAERAERSEDETSAERSERAERAERALRGSRASSWEQFQRANEAVVEEKAFYKARDAREKKMFDMLYGKEKKETAVADSEYHSSSGHLAHETASALFGDSLAIDELELYGEIE